MKNKNVQLTVVLIILMVISVGLGFWQKGENEPQIDTKLFVVENIDRIDRVVITRGDEIMDCRAFSGGFMINDQFLMDENLLTVLAAVLQQIRIQRPLAGQQHEEARASIFEEGSHVAIFEGDQMLTSFWTGGDDSKKNSYFATEEGAVYLVHLPGYTSYVSGLFELTPGEWRSRTIFLNTWRSLLSFDYRNFSQPANDFSISYRDPFFTVSGVQRLDSNKVMYYLQDLVTLKASAVIDTIYHGEPQLQLTATDIDPAKNQVLTLYGDISQEMVLGRAGDQYFTFRAADLEPITKSSGFFQREE